MRQPLRASLLAILGLLLFASAFAHAFLGWPQLQADLVRIGASPELVGGLSAGWHFGSLCMAAFGLIGTLAAADAWRGRPVPTGSLAAMAAAYVVFGTSAFVLRGMNPHFLGFIVIGLLLALAAALRR